MAGTGQKLECDLVMRGGITSGIVYPRAIAKLAETHALEQLVQPCAPSGWVSSASCRC
jgi:hypothetical protein